MHKSVVSPAPRNPRNSRALNRACLLRPGSDTELFMSRTQFELRPTQTIWTGTAEGEGLVGLRPHHFFAPPTPLLENQILWFYSFFRFSIWKNYFQLSALHFSPCSAVPVGPAELIQTLILLQLNYVQKVKNAHFGQTAYKIRYNLCIRFGTWKARSLNQSRSKVAQKVKFPAGLGEKNG